MSAENVDLVRRLYAAFSARDKAWPFEVYDPEIEWDMSAVAWALELGFEPIYRGHDGVRALRRHRLDAWKSIEYHVDDLIDAGDDSRSTRRSCTAAPAVPKSRRPPPRYGLCAAARSCG